ncbi:MAG: NAD(P)H-dependent oxidoreductase subunit E, partial [Candidatus Omnitrophica bacterium]|nr:NAD(P)H-dependent oxidoreductase subunit E [Candidatus Omnitrophota bacterium]
RPINGRIEEILEERGRDSSRVIPILQAIQEEFQYLPREAMERVCQLTEITPSQLAGVASFYSQFRFKPMGRHLMRVCHGTACHVKGSDRVEDSIRRHLHMDKNVETDDRGEYTVERVACLGCCTLSPVVQIDDEVYGHLSPERVPEMVLDFEERDHTPRAIRNGKISLESLDGEIRIGLGSCCVAKGSDALRQALEYELAKSDARVQVKRVGCVGMCHRTPLVEVVLPDRPTTFYAEVKPEQARSIVSEHFPPRGLWKSLSGAFERFSNVLFEEEESEPIARYSIDTRDRPVAAFLDPQVHIATEHFGFLNPLDLEEYKSKGGFQALLKCLGEYTHEEVIEEIKTSGLRGRGGAGFPCGMKWERTRVAAGEKKYVICNGDEGDPGAFMDRMLLESFPYRVIEGMMIAAYSVGADEGILYVRAEYPLALRMLRGAIARMREGGLLGEKIFDSDFSFDVRIMEGAGAFVSGEETALLAAVEGQRSIPRLRPPYPAEKGLHGCPTSINNVETYASVPWILRNGGDEYAKLGTEKSKGTKVFALAGKVKNGGLIEIP